ncbi:hypothetical protein VUN82_00400 [Micrococcaceae bacterium Sec5.1]
MYSPFVRKIVTGLALAGVLLSGVFALLGVPPSPGFVWVSAAIGVASLLAALVLPLSPKRDTGLFVMAGIAGGVFFGASGFGFPQNIPLWIWVICCIGAATLAIVTDADSAQSKSVNRL